VGLSISGCTRQYTPPPEQELRVHLASEPATVDPSLAEDGASLKILGNTAEGLVGYDGEGRLVARAAAEWKISGDGRTYTFSLRPDLKWSDGVPLEAGHFVTGIRRTLDPRQAARLGQLLSPVEKIEARDARTLVITLRKKTPYFLKVLSLPIAAPQRQDILDAHGGAWPVVAPSASSYFIVERKPEQHWLIRKNPHYGSAPAAGAPETVRLMIVGEETSALALFDQGRIDLLARVPPLEQTRLEKQGVLSVKPFWATYYVGFNTRKKPLDQASVRCAIARKIDKAGVVTALGSGETVAESWVPPGMEGYFAGFLAPARAAVSTPARAGDSAARAAGAPSVRAGMAPALKLKAGFDSNSRNAMIMEKIQADLKQGDSPIEIELFNQDWKSYLRELKLNPPDLFRFGWLAAFADPISHLQALTSKNPNNLTGWSNARYDRLVSEIEGMEPGSAREKKVVEAQKILVAEDCAVVPIYHYVQVSAVNPRVKGYAVNGMGVVRWADLAMPRREF
jgi:oligopeptide transport system substrate-binding protein